ncbi:MAG TPA: PAS domain-containing protein, partial [Burkholderiaceae bacterium]|nr:PAS domain-containing protein [Burkholderiaceae bacterium]
MASAPFAPVALSAALLYGAGIWWGPVAALAGLLAAGAAWHALRLSEAVQAFRRTHGNVVSTLDSIGDAVFQLDADGRILYLNAAARALAARAEPCGLSLDQALALETESSMRLLSMIQRC